MTTLQSLTWWERLDRRNLLLAVRSTFTDGGCVVAEGTEGSGRRQAGRLCEAFYDESGFHPIRIPPSPGSPTMVRDVFFRAWERCSPPLTLGAVGPWTTQKRFITMTELIDQIGEACSTLPKRAAFIFENVDDVSPLPPNVVEHLPALCARTSSPVLVTSRQESRTNWRGSPSIKVQRLTDFDPTDVRSFIAVAPELAALSEAELDSLVVSMLPDEAKKIVPEVAYEVLESLSRK